MLYGSIEFTYAEPFANALVANGAFRSWVLRRTKFAASADQARLMHNEMRAQRSSSSATWWRSHYTETCRCQGCSGQETDILAIFEVLPRTRFGLHFEVKQPADKFPTKRDQAANYALRAKCWSTSAPKSVVPHDDAATVLLCSALRMLEYAPHLPKFGTVITFEEIAMTFPQATFRSPS
ncbi:MAG: hypothetical protein EOR84_18015 [Mesorhizobium sp.]|uniref:hypothetical protein n=1 Tax=Mesorhizobium sp. TaxID=1871066 RepID=UPI000FE71F54|nr:hypothetical protein [Mesorhizobium sp.]RWM93412.1 MAG: hypothetical protein EOR84_18015 [Mesorhizobium sp.]